MATQARIEKRRKNKRGNHSVKCWNSKWNTCTCSYNNGKPKGGF